MRKVAHTRNMEGNPMPAGLPASPEAAKPLCKHNCKSCRTQKKILKEQKRQTGILLEILKTQQQAQLSTTTVPHKLIDRLEVCQIFDFKQTKFYRIRHLFPCYTVGAKKYYYEHEVREAIERTMQKPKITAGDA